MRNTTVFLFIVSRLGRNQPRSGFGLPMLIFFGTRNAILAIEAALLGQMKVSTFTEFCLLAVLVAALKLAVFIKGLSIKTAQSLDTFALIDSPDRQIIGSVL
jgi:hypothetical protein